MTASGSAAVAIDTRLAAFSRQFIGNNAWQLNTAVVGADLFVGFQDVIYASQGIGSTYQHGAGFSFTVRDVVGAGTYKAAAQFQEKSERSLTGHAETHSAFFSSSGDDCVVTIAAVAAPAGYEGSYTCSNLKAHATDGAITLTGTFRISATSVGELRFASRPAMN